MRSAFLRSAAAPLNPRIFQKRIRAADPGIRPGEVVALRTSEGAFVGRAFTSPKSVIGARVLDRDEQGPPIDRAWFAERFAQAEALRRDLGIPDVTDAYRVVHAEGDGLSGLVVDRYAEIAVLELGARGMFEHLEEIEGAAREVLGVTRTVVRADADVERIEGFRVLDRHAGQARTVVHERGLAFAVDCRGGHKTGFFVDQREARAEVERLAKGRRVLDLCCYTGGFSLAAARGGAASVRGVDLDEEAVALARENAKRNRARAAFEHADGFDVLRSGAGADLLLLDPPKLASTPRELPRAREKSIDWNVLALRALGPGGLLFTFCCTGLFSAADFLAHLAEASHRADRPARVLRVTGQPPDHPVHLHCPEGRYLTGLLLQAL
ncbi:MAG: class I SAM-dependent rRNA methyltransferase [Planctomycetaceae bacterium]